MLIEQLLSSGFDVDGRAPWVWLSTMKRERCSLKEIALWILLISMVPAMSVAEPEGLSGNDIFQKCHLYLTKSALEMTESESFDATICTGYLNGFWQDVELQDILLKDEPEKLSICPPQNEIISKDRLPRLIVDYLKKRPSELNKPVYIVVNNALQEAFPCPEK